MTYRGAADMASSDIHALVEWGSDGRATRLKADHVRAEYEQVGELRRGQGVRRPECRA